MQWVAVISSLNINHLIFLGVKRKFSINLGASLSRVYQEYVKLTTLNICHLFTHFSQSRVANLQKMFFRERFMLNLNLRAGQNSFGDEIRIIIPLLARGYWYIPSRRCWNMRYVESSPACWDHRASNAQFIASATAESCVCGLQQ